MNSLAAFLAALVLALPAAPGMFAPAAEDAHAARTAGQRPEVGRSRNEAEAFRAFRDDYRNEAQDQVRIEQHMVIRITPGPPAVRRDLFPPPPPGPEGPQHYREKSYHGCVAIKEIVGITPMRPNRLVLFMRKHHVLSASLERACDPDAFYLGAYVERSPDGKLCTGRDVLRARSGATCQISSISRLVAIKD